MTIRWLVVAVIMPAPVVAQTSDFTYFRASMAAANVVPAADSRVAASQTITAHVLREADGEIISGSVSFDLLLAAVGGAQVTVTGLHIHRGRRGENGPAVIDTGLSPSLTQPVSGFAQLTFQSQVLAGDTNGLRALRDMVRTPDEFYADLHTAAQPDGAVRVQLEKAEIVFLGALMDSGSVVPPARTTDGSGFGVAVLLVSRDANGAVTGAAILSRIVYDFEERIAFSAWHIHQGKAGQAGPSVLAGSFIAGGSIPLPASGVIGSGAIPPFFNFGEVSFSNADQRGALLGILANPGDYYVDLHTADSPGGAIRGQFRRMDRIDIPVTAIPAAVSPPVAGSQASATGNVTLSTLRQEDGRVSAGVAYFDINHRFPANTAFTGMHVHSGAAGQNGDVTIDAGLPLRTLSPGGSGNLNRFTFPIYRGEALIALDAIVRTPERYYIDLHTVPQAGGAVRAQLGSLLGTPFIAGVVSGNLVTRGSIAPNGLFTIFGRNLAKLPSSLDGWQGATLPLSLNGVDVGIGESRPRILFVSPGQINAIAPADLPAGTYQLAVSNGDAISAPVEVRVERASPAVFVQPGGEGLVVKAANQSLVNSSNPASPGDVLLVYSTGLGATTPPLSSGQIVPAAGRFETSMVTAMIDGRSAEVLSSVASPGFAGLYQTAVRVPAGALAGNRPLVLSIGGIPSNAVTIAIR